MTTLIPIAVNLTERGVPRVLESKPGMTFIVDKVSPSGSYPGQWVAHVRDYRYKNGAAPFQIWSLGPGDYTAVDVRLPAEQR